MRYRYSLGRCCRHQVTVESGRLGELVARHDLIGRLSGDIETVIGDSVFEHVRMLGHGEDDLLGIGTDCWLHDRTVCGVVITAIVTVAVVANGIICIAVVGVGGLPFAVGTIEHELYG